MVVSHIYSNIYCSLFPRKKMRIGSHAPSRKHPITISFTVHSSTVRSQRGTCFLSPFWQLKFGKFVNPMVTFVWHPILDIGKFPIWRVNKQVSNLNAVGLLVVAFISPLPPLWESVCLKRNYAQYISMAVTQELLISIAMKLLKSVESFIQHAYCQTFTGSTVTTNVTPSCPHAYN